ncbi:MAG: KpsF/GutQ family sugar-phosphate isomerase [Vampirovibrionales bacterium]|jgi:arabinose-5-phosphate isomerase|nr:KpsF/GutQ family sugar-phosphate isomerase [Vampirovibrionales bacterium]
MSTNTLHFDARIHQTALHVLDVESLAVQAMKASIDNGFFASVALIEARQAQGGRVMITGMGKSGHIGRKMAATLSSTGTPAYFMHPAEGRHGDLGMVTSCDVVIAISNSGETEELLGLLPSLHTLETPIIAMTAKAHSTLAKQAVAILNVAVPEEACPLGLAPTASTTATLALGDALAVVLQENKGFASTDFALFHPAGMLGKRLLLKVEDLMHTGDALPYVKSDDLLLQALIEMSQKKMGMTLVQSKAGDLCGVLTDGDVRRALMKHGQAIAQVLVDSVMSPSPQRISKQALAVDALRHMEERKITAIVVEDETAQIVGVLHLHDLLAQGL